MLVHQNSHSYSQFNLILEWFSNSLRHKDCGAIPSLTNQWETAIQRLLHLIPLRVSLLEVRCVLEEDREEDYSAIVQQCYYATVSKLCQFVGTTIYICLYYYVIITFNEFSKPARRYCLKSHSYKINVAKW